MAITKFKLMKKIHIKNIKQNRNWQSHDTLPSAISLFFNIHNWHYISGVSNKQNLIHSDR